MKNTAIAMLSLFIHLASIVMLAGCQAATTSARGNDPSLRVPLSSGPLVANKTIHIKQFGAVGNGISNDTKAFQEASAYLQKNGGTLIIDSGLYIVGKQNLPRTFGGGSSYMREPIIDVRNAINPIVIKGEKAILKCADGLKLGSFNPVTGRKDSLRKTSHVSDYQASAFIFINAENCESISIEGLTLDGNSANLDIGPMFDKLGIQLMATGIRVTNNKKVSIENCYIHHCALDAIIVAWDGLTNNHPIYPHTINNVKAVYNGRQGISWVGGNSLVVTNSEFSSTGKSLNKGRYVIGEPTAGIDIEIENSIIKNGFFINCIVNDNAGPGLSSIGHDTYNINFRKTTFIGTSNYAAYPRTQHLSFDSCTFVGAVWGVLGSPDSKKANFYKNCLFTMDSSKSPSGRVYGNFSSFYEAQNIVFDNCEFDAGNRKLPEFSQKEIVFKNCKFYQKSNESFRASAIFKGSTMFFMTGRAKINTDESKFEGEVFYNGKKLPDPGKLKFE